MAAAAGGSKRRGAGACWPWSLVYWSSAQPACGGGAKALEARGSVIRGGGFCRPPTPVPLVAASLSLLPSFALTALEESEAHPLLISKTLRLSSALPSAPISSSAPNPPLTPLIALQQTAHSPHHRLISCCILMPQNLPSTSHLPVSCAKPSMLPACHEPCVEVLA